MNDKTRKLLFDVLDSGRAIRHWRTGRTYEEYLSDRQFRRAVEREFEIIGEALNRLSAEDAGVAAQIAELPRIVAFRNRIIRAMIPWMTRAFGVSSKNICLPLSVRRRIC